MRSRSQNPFAGAMTSIGWRLCSIISRAASTRQVLDRLGRRLAGLGVERTAELRGLRCALRRAAEPSAAYGDCASHMPVRAGTVGFGSSSSSAENCDWPPARR